MNLYISNLDSRTTEKDIDELFSEFGKVHTGRIRTIMDTRTKSFNTFSYVDVPTDSIAKLAIDKYSNAVFLGCTITIEKAG